MNRRILNHDQYYKFHVINYAFLFIGCKESVRKEGRKKDRQKGEEGAEGCVQECDA